MFVFVHTLTLTIPKKDPLRCISDRDMTSPKRFLFTQSKQEPRSYRVINDLFCFESGRTDCGIESFPLEPSFWELGVAAYKHWFQNKKRGLFDLATLPISRQRENRIMWQLGDLVKSLFLRKPNEVHTYKSTAEFNRNGIKEKWRCRTYGHQLPSGVVVHKTRVCTLSP